MSAPYDRAAKLVDDILTSFHAMLNERDHDHVVGIVARALRDELKDLHDQLAAAQVELQSERDRFRALPKNQAAQAAAFVKAEELGIFYPGHDTAETHQEDFEAVLTAAVEAAMEKTP